MAEMFESGITVTFVCAFCGKRYTYKAFAKREVQLSGDWMEATIDYSKRRFYKGDREQLLFCSSDHATNYKALESEATKIANGAFHEHIRQGQSRARSAVDALGDTVRDA